MLNEIIWGDDYLIGMAEIDSQHEYLAGLINRCANVLKEKISLKRFAKEFEELESRVIDLDFEGALISLKLLEEELQLE